MDVEIQVAKSAFTIHVCTAKLNDATDKGNLFSALCVARSSLNSTRKITDGPRMIGFGLLSLVMPIR